MQYLEFLEIMYTASALRVYQTRTGLGQYRRRLWEEEVSHTVEAEYDDS